MLILLAIFVGINFIHWERFEQFITYKLLYTALVYTIQIIQFISLMAIISVIYRRIADFSKNKPNAFKKNMEKLFIILFVIPLLYTVCSGIFIDIIPITLTNIINFTIIFILFPIQMLVSIAFCFPKRK